MKIAVISSHTTSLFWFRMDMMREFMRHGHEVLAVGSESEEDWGEMFIKEGIEYRQITVSRNGLNPVNDWKTFASIKTLLKKEHPDKIFVYQAKTIAYACMAAKSVGIDEVYPMVAGLGSIFRGTGLKNALVKRVMSTLYKKAFAYARTVIFQNTDDKKELLELKLLPESKCAIVNGSGVNLDKFTPSQLPSKPAFLFVGRLIRDKGVFEYLQACADIKKRHLHAKCVLIGPFDTNPSALNEAELAPFIEQGIIEYYGEQSDVRPYLDECSTYVLPSYHEGTPKSVLEAMAKGRAIITTDAPGCRETVIEGLNGYLVPTKNVEALVEKMDYLITHPHINQEMGNASLKIAREKYDVNIINRDIMKIMNLETKN